MLSRKARMADNSSWIRNNRFVMMNHSRATIWTVISTLLSLTAAHAQQNLLAPRNTESDNQTVLTYSQHYLDAKNNAVEYTGILYLKLESLALSTCQLSAEVVVQDRYTGSEEKRGIVHVTKSFLGEHVYTYRYSYQIDLKKTPELQIDLAVGRPYQLNANTGFTCKEDSTCKLHWLQLKTNIAGNNEKRVLNGLVDFHRNVSEIWLPATSHDNALGLQKTLQQTISSCR